MPKMSGKAVAEVTVTTVTSGAMSRELSEQPQGGLNEIIAL
jgi:hypothetical protein